MKEGFDKEIDSLLRRRARGAVKSFADGDGALATASAHLDADELGAFAEGALPSPARLAAASHLADCDRCRGAAVALSRSLGGGAELKQAAAVPALTATKKPASWGAWAAALFSPRVLRYAAPVLALSVVAVVSFVALRTRNSGALNDTMSPRPQTEVSKTQSGTAAPLGAATTNDNTAGLVAQNQENTPGNQNAGTTARQPPEGRGPNAPEPQPESVGAVGGVAAPAAVAAEDTSAPPPPPAASPESQPEIAKTAPPRPVVHDSEVASKADAKAESRDKQKSAREAETGEEVTVNDLAVQQQRRAAQNRANEVQMPDGGSRNQQQKRGADSNSSIYGGNAGTSAQPKESERDDRAANAPRRGRSNTRGEQRQQMDETTRVGETREAAGHRFRREGSVWVDVKYKSSMSSTGVRRGTEAFRALVADAPVIGRIAQQIPGEVIVVVSGRAYRIQ
ncbi:MAG TPA: hypothetical protein VFZ44_19315 [Pyrinomonadaceae bacterium]